MKWTTLALLVVLIVASSVEAQKSKSGKKGKEGRCRIGPGFAFNSTVVVGADRRRDVIDFTDAQLIFNEDNLYACYVPRAAGGTLYNGCNLGVLEGSAYDYTYDPQTGVLTVCTIFGVDMQNSQGPALGGSGQDACNFGGCGTYQVSWTPDCSGGALSIISDACEKRSTFAPAFATFVTAASFDPTCPLVAATCDAGLAVGLNIRPESESESSEEEAQAAANLKPQEKINPANLKPQEKVDPANLKPQEKIDSANLKPAQNAANLKPVEKVEEEEAKEEVEQVEEHKDSQVIKVQDEGRAQQEMSAVKSSSSSSKWSNLFKFAGGAVAGAVVAAVATVLINKRKPERAPLLVH